MAVAVAAPSAVLAGLGPLAASSVVQGPSAVISGPSGTVVSQGGVVATSPAVLGHSVLGR